MEERLISKYLNRRKVDNINIKTLNPIPFFTYIPNNQIITNAEHQKGEAKGTHNYVPNHNHMR